MADGVTVAPCPRCQHYAGIKTAIYGAGGMDAGPIALALSCDCEVKMAFYTGDEPFGDCGHFPEDTDVVDEAMYDG